MKNSFTLFEVILSLTISSIVIIYSMNYTKELFFSNKTIQKTELEKINLINTKIFLQKHKNELEKVEFQDEKLYFDKSLLLENVKEFELKRVDSFITILINYNDIIKQEWKF